MTLKITVQSAMTDGRLSGFGSQMNTCNQHQQLLESGYLSEWRSGGISDDELNTFIDMNAHLVLDSPPARLPALSGGDILDKV